MADRVPVAIWDFLEKATPPSSPTAMRAARQRPSSFQNWPG